MSTKGQLIAVCANATAGKDTFFSLLKTHLSNRVVTRAAFADELRRELDPLFKAFGGTAWETDPVKKAAQRPVLIAHGMAQRIISNGRHWIDAIEPHVKESLARGETVVLTDCRFPNEADWVKSLGGKLLYIERTLPDGTVVPPVNKDEAENGPILKSRADATMIWPTIETNGLWPYVEKAAQSLGLS